MQHYGRSTRWIFFGMAALLFGCATTEDVRILDKESRRQTSQTSTLRKEMESLRAEFSTLQREVQASQSERKKEIGSLQKEDQLSKADLLLRIDNLQSEVKTLTSGVEEYKDFVKKPSKEIDRMREDVVYRTRVLEEKWKAFDEKTRAEALAAIQVIDFVAINRNPLFYIHLIPFADN